MRSWRGPRALHDTAKILLNLALTVALGVTAPPTSPCCVANHAVFGPVASDPTVSRAIDTLAHADTEVTTAIRAARAWVWHRARAPARNGWLVLDLDATILISHSNKEDATTTWKKPFGFHPLQLFCDHDQNGTDEPVAGLLRRGSAGSKHRRRPPHRAGGALAEMPAHLRQPDADGKMKVQVRTGAPHAFTGRITGLGMEFSLGGYLHHFDIHAILTQPGEWVG